MHMSPQSGPQVSPSVALGLATCKPWFSWFPWWNTGWHRYMESPCLLVFRNALAWLWSSQLVITYQAWGLGPLWRPPHQLGQLWAIGSHDSLWVLGRDIDRNEAHDVWILEMPLVGFGACVSPGVHELLCLALLCKIWAQMLTRGDMAHTPSFVKGMVAFSHILYVMVPVKAWPPLALASRRKIKP